jgi:2-oxoglutarate ferredoxin oxidoreductase subunit gamma
VTEKIIIAGAGGQGIMVLGRVLAEAALEEDKYVTWLPAYGAEVRGGTANCMVTISDQEIGSPYIDKADALIIMNELSAKRFVSRLKGKGLLVLNSSLAKTGPNKKATVLNFPFTDIALKLGNIKAANIVALGCFVAKSKVVDPKTIMRVIEEMAPADRRELVLVNKKALSAGKDLVSR